MHSVKWRWQMCRLKPPWGNKMLERCTHTHSKRPSDVSGCKTCLVKGHLASWADAVLEDKNEAMQTICAVYLYKGIQDCIMSSSGHVMFWSWVANGVFTSFLSYGQVCESCFSQNYLECHHCRCVKELWPNQRHDFVAMPFSMLMPFRVLEWSERRCTPREASKKESLQCSNSFDFCSLIFLSSVCALQHRPTLLRTHRASF